MRMLLYRKAPNKVTTFQFQSSFYVFTFAEAIVLLFITIALFVKLNNKIFNSCLPKLFPDFFLIKLTELRGNMLFEMISYASFSLDWLKLVLFHTQNTILLKCDKNCVWKREKNAHQSYVILLHLFNAFFDSHEPLLHSWKLSS